MRLMAECPVHGWFPADWAIGGTGAVSLKNVRVDCPRCDRMAYAVDAIYTSAFSDDDTTMSPNSASSLAQLRRLKTALEWAEREVAKPDVDPEEVRRKLTATVEREAPALARALNAVLSNRGIAVATWIGVLIMLVQMFMTNAQPPVLTRDDIVKMVDQIEQHHDEQLIQESPEAPPEPSPSDTPG